MPRKGSRVFANYSRRRALLTPIWNIQPDLKFRVKAIRFRSKCYKFPNKRLTLKDFWKTKRDLGLKRKCFSSFLSNLGRWSYLIVEKSTSTKRSTYLAIIKWASIEPSRNLGSYRSSRYLRKRLEFKKLGKPKFSLERS